MDLAFFEKALEHGMVRVDFEADTVWAQRLQVYLSAVLGATTPIIELRLENALLVEIIVVLMVRIVVERPQHFVNVSDRFVTHFIHHVVVIVQREPMVQLHYVSGQALPDVHSDVFQCLPRVLFFQNHFGLRQVNIEVIKAGLQAI